MSILGFDTVFKILILIAEKFPAFRMFFQEKINVPKHSKLSMMIHNIFADSMKNIDNTYENIILFNLGLISLGIYKNWY